MAPSDIHFDRFVLCPRSRELLDAGTPVRIGARAFDLLCALVEAGGDVVSRDALFERAWPGRVVIDDNLKVQVMALRKVLGPEAVIAVPRRGYRFGLAMRPCGASAALAADAHAGLIGREAEMAQLQQALSNSRLVSLVGPGGVGKTRLAGAVAKAHAARFPDGVCVVELASLADARRVPEAVARALRLPAMPGRVDDAAIARACAPLATLIVLDNCEHVLGAVASMVQRLLEIAPQLRVLTTSQEPLALRGEHIMRLSGLRCPEASAIDGALDHTAPALRLFAARAGALDPRFVLDGDSAAAVAQICRRLEGLPLALELAAARVPLLGAGGVLERLDHQLKLLTRGPLDAPARQQTLRAAMQWSHGLLDATQKTVFRRLAVFGDSFTLQAAQAVAADASIDEWAVLDALDALVAKSLLQMVPGGAPLRCRLLATARAFALERLDESGERAATHRRHAQWVLQLFEQALPRLPDEPMLAWMNALWPEVHDLRAALRWADSADGDAALLLALVGVAGPFWAMISLDREAAPWLAATRALVHDHTPPLRAALYWQAVALRSVEPTAPIAEAVAAAERAADLFERLGDAPSLYRMTGLRVQHGRRVNPQLDVQPLLQLMRTLERPEWSALRRMHRLRVEGIAMARDGDWHAYRERFRAEARMLAQAGDEMREWGAQYHVALGEIALGHPRAAIEALVPVVQRLRALGLLREQWTRPIVLLIARIEAGEALGAADHVREALTLLRVAGAPGYIADHLSLWALDCGAVQHAARLAGWADATAARRAEPRNWHARRAHERTSVRLDEALGTARHQALRDEGHALDDDAALRLVLEIAATPQPRAAPRAQPRPMQAA